MELVMDVFKVGNDLILDPLNKKVIRNGDDISLPELSYRLLLELVEHAPEIVPHDQLIKAVWKDRVVSDENLKKRISRLRDSIADNHSEPKYIVAERGMGYRCVATVRKIKRSESAYNDIGDFQATYYSIKRLVYRLPIWLVASFGVLAIGMSSFVLFHHENENPPNEISEALDYRAAQNYLKFTEKDNDTAISLYQDAINREPQNAASHSGLSDAYLRGYWHYGKDKDWLELGKKHAEKAVQINDDLAWGHKALGLAYYLSGQYENAIASFNLARQIEPSWGEIPAYASLVEIQLGHFIKAHKLAILSVELDPGNPFTNAILGELYRQSYRFYAAEEQFSKTLNIDPGFLMSRLFFSEYLLESGRHVQAISVLRDVIHKQQNSQQARWLLGLALLIDNQIEEAIDEFSAASSLGGRYYLSAAVYLAALKKDRSELSKLGEQIAKLKLDGDQWAELTFLEGIVLLINDKGTEATNKFESAIFGGLTTTYRYTHLPINSSITTSHRFNELLNLIESKNKDKMPKRIPPRT